MTTTVTGGEVGERDSDEPEAACILDVDGIRRVFVRSSIRDDIKGFVSGVWEGYDD